jgi:hypothetical protein
VEPTHGSILNLSGMLLAFRRPSAQSGSNRQPVAIKAAVSGVRMRQSG